MTILFSANLWFLWTDRPLGCRKINVLAGRTGGTNNLKILFDCFDTQIVEGDVVHSLKGSIPHVGQVQFASAPDRTEPHHGGLDYSIVLPALVDVGYDGLFEAEDHPLSDTAEGLTWLDSWRAKDTTS